MFIVIDTVTEQEYSPPYDYHDKGGYIPVTRTKVTEFKNQADLLSYLDKWKLASTGGTRRVFKAEELAIKTTVTVELVKPAQR